MTAEQHMLKSIKHEFQGIYQDLDQVLAARSIILDIAKKLQSSEKQDFHEGANEVISELETFKAKLTQLQDMFREVSEVSK